MDIFVAHGDSEEPYNLIEMEDIPSFRGNAKAASFILSLSPAMRCYRAIVHYARLFLVYDLALRVVWSIPRPDPTPFFLTGNDKIYYWSAPQDVIPMSHPDDHVDDLWV
jgi:hypothetical protein